MKFRVRHTTRYSYGAPVSDGQNSTVVLPRQTQWQQIERSSIAISPDPSWSTERSDWFGNRVVDFAIETLHDTLEVTAESSVEVFVPSLPLWDDTPPWEQATGQLDSELMLDVYRLPSALIPAISPELLDYARTSFTPDRPIISAVMDLTARIYRDFAMCPAAQKLAPRCRRYLPIAAGCARTLLTWV